MTNIEYVTACFSCAQGLFSECLDPLETPEGHIIPCVQRYKPAGGEAGGGALAPTMVTDAKSTGRKRAVMLAPILEGMLCEWAGLRQAGGGPIPIVGCAGNQLSDKKNGDEEQGWLPGHLHHGPDKATLNNAVGTNLHRVCAVCITGEMRVLTEQLEWIRADELEVGARLIGFTEELRGSVFEPSIVTAVERVLEPSYRIHMKNGDVLTSSHAHQWVASRPSDGHAKWFRTEQFDNRYETSRQGHFTLRKLVDPWEFDTSREAGWLAGFLDGEGCLSGNQLSVSQTLSGGNELSAARVSSMFAGLSDRVNTFLRRPAKQHWKPTTILRVSNLPDIMRILGQIRPERLMSKWADFLYRGRAALGNKGSRQEIDHIEYVGEIEVYSITTSTSTMIVEGYLSHNCHNRWHAANDPFYGTRGEAHQPFLPTVDYYLHDANTEATVEEQEAAEKWWGIKRKEKRGDYPIVPEGLRKIAP